MQSALKYTAVLFLLTGLMGCARAKVYYPGQASPDTQTAAQRLNAQAYWDNVKRLERELAALSPAIDAGEARQVAETAIRESAILAGKYRLVRPAVAHNLLIALGIKDRGLCYHWTEDLMHRLQLLQLKSFKLHWAVAYRGSELREHNCVVIAAKGQPFHRGLVLDPWRNSGNLYWARVNHDRYTWQVLPPAEW